VILLKFASRLLRTFRHCSCALVGIAIANLTLSIKNYLRFFSGAG
jgi:hypothetical protein